MNLTTTKKSGIIHNFGMESRDQLAILKLMPNADPAVITQMEIDIRNEKIRAYLERRFWKYKTINKELYAKVGGDLKFLGL